MLQALIRPARTATFRRLAARFGLAGTNKQALSCSRDRMSALNDPATRRALTGLPPHLLRDIGAVGQGHSAPDAMPEGEALRRHLW